MKGNRGQETKKQKKQKRDVSRSRHSYALNCHQQKSQAFAWLFYFGGEDGDRTHDLIDANAALSQQSYPPTEGPRIIRMPSPEG